MEFIVKMVIGNMAAVKINFLPKVKYLIMYKKMELNFNTITSENKDSDMENMIRVNVNVCKSIGIIKSKMAAEF